MKNELKDLKINEESAFKKCPSCEKNNANELHTCPFKEEINNDSETLCECCDDCTHECAMDI